MIFAGYVFGFFLFVFCVYLFLVFPSRPSSADRARFAGRNYAHRGLFDNATERPENSLPAFEAAMQAGYGCELDVQFTKDRQLIVFHDNDYKRLCGVDRPVWELTYAETQSLRLLNTNERVPLFSEVLATVAGRAPLIVEIKAEGLSVAWYNELSAAVLAMLRGYSGDYCIESFHPSVVGWYRKHAPDIVRGQLLGGYRGSLDSLSKPLAFILSNMMTNVYTRPHFIAYTVRELPRLLGLQRSLGGMVVLWTVTSQAEQDALSSRADAVIFEQYTPDSRL